MEEMSLLKKFYKNNISMWNPNTNYLTYLEHFKKILKYCFENKTCELSYEKWLNLLNTDSEHSTIGSETHNICDGLNIIDSTYTYRTTEEVSKIKISIPKDLIYQFYMDNMQLENGSWKIIQKRYFKFLNDNNIFKIEGKTHIQRVCLNLFICYLIDTNKYTSSEIKNYIRFAQDNGVSVEEKINKVYNFDVCKPNSSILEKLMISSNGKELPNGETFKNAILHSLNDDINNFENSNELHSISSKKENVTKAFNMIYYGIPGSGKSYIVDEKYNDLEYKIYRTTFHPEYTNSDFVGQIIPTVKDNKVEYNFHPGAFTLALKYALENKDKKVCLIIEEINRGNSSAIFGDIFQLLDRNEEGKSKYEIFNGPILDYLNENGMNLERIHIPSNMWIIATMNTSDQNIFTLDTAFKRRWKMEYIKNIFADNDKSKELKNKVIPFGEKYPNVTWEKFVNKINNHIIHDTSGINAEDKQLGKYFVSVEEIDNMKEFSEKILSYLWEDVAKLNASYWFGTISSYEELLESFNKNTLDVFNSLFEDEIKANDEYLNENIGE